MVSRKDDDSLGAVPGEVSAATAVASGPIGGSSPHAAPSAESGRSRAGAPSPVAAPAPPAESRTRRGPSSTDGSELPETYGVDEVEIIAKDPSWYFVYWEITEPGLEAARAQLGPSADRAKQVLRIFVTAAQTGPGGRETVVREIRDVVLGQRHGRKYLELPRQHVSSASSGGTLLRAAVGLLTPEGYFAPLANSSLLRMPPHQPAVETSVEWLHVQPSREGGAQRERILKSAQAAHVERALPWRVTAGGTPREGSDDTLTLDGPLSGSAALDSGYATRERKSAGGGSDGGASNGSGQGMGGAGR